MLPDEVTLGGNVLEQNIPNFTVVTPVKHSNNLFLMNTVLNNSWIWERKHGKVKNQKQISMLARGSEFLTVSPCFPLGVYKWQPILQAVHPPCHCRDWNGAQETRTFCYLYLQVKATKLDRHDHIQHCRSVSSASNWNLIRQETGREVGMRACVHPVRKEEPDCDTAQ